MHRLAVRSNRFRSLKSFNNFLFHPIEDRSENERKQVLIHRSRLKHNEIHGSHSFSGYFHSSRAEHFGGPLQGSMASLACPVFAFVLFPVLDFIGGVVEPIQKERKSSAYRNILYLYVLIETACLIYSGKIFLSATPWERVGLIVQAGVVSGGMGITVAHELMHKNDRLSVFFAEILLIQVFYAHYLVEHVLGHHSHVATPHDPTTSRLGESYYAFLPRTLFGSLKSAWNIEKKRLSRQQTPPFHYRNRALWYWGIEIALAVGLALIFGWPACIYFLGESFVAINLLEIINYTEHYGLRRNETAVGKYERVTENHSWESRRRLTNFLLINLQLHSDHHIHPTKPYQELVSLRQSTTARGLRYNGRCRFGSAAFSKNHGPAGETGFFARAANSFEINGSIEMSVFFACLRRFANVSRAQLFCTQFTSHLGTLPLGSTSASIVT